LLDKIAQAGGTGKTAFATDGKSLDANPAVLLSGLRIPGQGGRLSWKGVGLERQLAPPGWVRAGASPSALYFQLNLLYSQRTMTSDEGSMSLRFKDGTRILALAALLALLPGGRARGEAAAPGGLSDQNPVRATLVASVEAAAVDEEFSLGVRLEMAPHWHVYWISPGNTGTPTRVTFGWDKERAGVEGPRFPVPETFDADDPEFLSFGYSEQVLIPGTATIVERPPGGVTTFTASASWLACKKTCINGKAELSLKLPLAQKARPSEKWARAFAALAPRLPVEADAERAWLESLTYDKGSFIARLRVTGLKRATDFIPSLPAGGICTIQERRVQPAAGGGQLLLLRFSGDKCLPGLGGLVLGEPTDRDAGAGALMVSAIPREGTEPAGPAEPVATPKEQEQKGAAVGAGAASGGGSDQGGPLVPRESLLLMLLFAFLGGLLLNVMPCVIPVVVPKMLSVVRTAQKADAAEQRKVLWAHGLAYTGGVVATMLSLGVTVVILKLVGREVGWGFQFQNPWFLLFMISLLLVLGLGMLHVFPLQSAAHQDQLKSLKKRRRKKPHLESFLTGLLVTFLGTPCTAPLLGPALGYAFTASTFEILLLMGTVGLGLAAPFLLLGAWTGWTRVLPTRVSDRYDRIMRGMAFLLFGTGVWLLGVLASAYGTDAAINVTWFLLALGLGSWIFGLLAKESDPWRKRLVRLAPVALLVTLFGVWILDFPSGASARAASASTESGLIKWQPFTEKKVKTLQAGGRSVFIDFTADWCMNCKANEKLVIETEETSELITRLGVVPLKADNTRGNPVIHRWLKRFGRAGVPMYIVLPPCGDIKQAALLPEILTSNILHEALNKAGPSRRCDRPKGG
jgi:thiol:disulfide interchange protein DsbD